MRLLKHFFILTVSLVILSACKTETTPDVVTNSIEKPDITPSILEGNSAIPNTDQDSPEKPTSDETEKDIAGSEDIESAQNSLEKSVALFPFISDNRYGYMNQKGETVIQPQFDRAMTFSDGLASVEIGRKVGYINTDGKYIINPQFIYGGDFSDGLASVQIDNDVGYINKNGEVIIQPQFEYAKPFSDGLAGVCLSSSESGSWGQEKCGYINKEGNIQVNYQFSFVHPFQEGVALVASIDENDYEGIGKWGFIKKNGDYIINQQYDDAGIFSEGLAPVGNNGKWGFINKKGEYAINPQYDHAFPFSEGLAAVCNHKDSEPSYEVFSCGFVDRTGLEVIKLEFEHRIGTERGGGLWDFTHIAFTDGLALMQTGKKYGYINKNGEVKINPNFVYAEPFEDGFARVTVNENEIGVINKDGKVLHSESQ